VTGGAFYRSNDSVTSTTAYPATVSAFGLDKFEVTVGRFRSFVNAVVTGWVPTTGAGKHAHLNGGDGLDGTTGGSEGGWIASWNVHLLSTKAEWDDSLACGGAATWKGITGNENKPLNCVNWYQAYAYCIWDGGFLPSEAEWNYAAAGGAQQRYYAWSIPSDSTEISADYAVYLGAQEVADGGSKSPLGDGRWLQRDLSGNLWEWTLDLHEAYGDECNDCANIAAGAARVIRGGGLYSSEAQLTSSHRASSDPTDQLPYLGFRCARSP
jgi:sulfatase modifying factor 1